MMSRLFRISRGAVKRMPALLSLFIVCGTVHAEWTSVGRFDRGEFFIDRSTLQIKGDQREIWSVMNYRNPEMDPKGHIFRSTRSLLQLQCKVGQARAIHMAFFSGSMLGGKQISNMGSLPGWDQVLPDSPMRKILDLVCRS